jgi:cytochrome b
MKTGYSNWDKLIHAGLAIFGIAAYLTAEGAEGSRASFGYLMHAYLGFTVTAFIGMRLLTGTVGRPEMRFTRWWPLKPSGLRLAFDDLRSLVRLHFPERGTHEGIAGFVQLFGLGLFAWMCATGVVLFAFHGKAYHALHEAAEEMHEIGEGLIPAFLLVHVGAVIAHSVFGAPVWRRMFAPARPPVEESRR